MKQRDVAMPTLRACVAAVCLISGAAVSLADTPSDARPPMDGPRGPHGFAPDGGPGPLGAPGRHDTDMFEELRPPPYLRDVKLSDEQSDKIFALLHAASPKFRDQLKAAHKAREALFELGDSSSFDEAKAQSLSQALGSSEGQVSLLHARLDHDIFMTLTPEQRSQIADRKRQEGPPHPRGSASP
jgi:protein CpxP